MKRSTLRYILAVMLVLALVAFAGCSTQQKAADTTAPSNSETDKATEPAAAQVYTRGEIKTADEAKQLLIDGNKRYTSGAALADDISAAKREDLVKNGQHPFATIVTCSDSRVSPEILFDQGLSDVFIIRTAGNVVDPIATGSVEYGTEHLGTPLLVVMGHSSCGAVKATVDTVQSNGKMEGNIGAIMTKIKPTVEKVKAAGTAADALFSTCEDENVKAVIADLEKSPVIKHLVEAGKLKVVGAKYHLDSGEVQWFDAK